MGSSCRRPNHTSPTPDRLAICDAEHGQPFRPHPRPLSSFSSNVETALHGTPLFAALLQDAPDAFRALVEGDARLSAGEEQNPAATAALARMFDRFPDLKQTYGRR